MDSLYLAAVCSRYMQSYDRAEDYLIHLLKLAPDMGRVYQELGHLKRATGDIETAIDHYRQPANVTGFAGLMAGSFRILQTSKQ